MDMRIDTCKCKCIDMRIRHRHVRIHVYRKVYRHVYKHVYRHGHRCEKSVADNDRAMKQRFDDMKVHLHACVCACRLCGCVRACVRACA